jgi:hypothetical protein
MWIKFSRNAVPHGPGVRFGSVAFNYLPDGSAFARPP